MPARLQNNEIFYHVTVTGIETCVAVALHGRIKAMKPLKLRPGVPS